MSDLEMKVTVDTSEAKSEIESTEAKAEDTKKRIDEINKQAEIESELTFIKTVQTVQRLSSIVNRSVSLMGDNVSKVTKATISTITQGIEVLTPLLTAQSLSGWQTAQAVLGFIALAQATTRLALLISEENQTSQTFNDVNMDVGRIQW